MQVEYADLSLLGGREENQDRVAVAVAEHSALLVVVDGMGGHAIASDAAIDPRDIRFGKVYQTVRKFLAG